jgi:PAS domain S-box-containing protein
VLAYNLLSILCVPLKVKDEITGVIYADNRIHSGVFTEHELELLTAFANQAAVAIENARLFEAQRCTLAEVTELKNLMDNVFSSIASGVITTDAEEKITMCNRAAEQILGLRRSDVIGHRLKEALPQLSQSLSGYMQSVWRNGRDWTGIELEIIPSHGGSLYLSLNLSPLKDAAQATQGIAIVIDDLTEKKRLEAQHRLFERMVSPSVIEQLNPDKLQLGGKRAEITTLFADIRGFTGLGERVPPEVLVSVLNLYLAAAAEAILAHQGTIDKFLGDAILAWFNAPIPQPDHALRAVLAALDLHKAVLRIQKDLPPEFRLSFGAGIHSGEAVLGLVGTQKRLEYTAIGDSVNIAKRIQESTAPGQILISADTHRLLGDQVEARPVQVPIVKGKNRSIQAYEVLGIKNVL